MLLLVFNREGLTRGLIENLRHVKPRRVYVSADGPRPTHPEDVAKVASTRAVIDEIDWNCEVIRRFSERNEGCRYGPTQGIDWFFAQVDEGIILEDDIRFDPTFLLYCKELLERFRDDPRVFCVCGYNFLESADTSESYRFTRIPLTWGWATWRVRWQEGQMLLKELPGALDELDLDWLPTRHDRRDIRCKLREAFEENHVWDFLWMYAIWKQGGVAVVPRHRVTGNHGVGKDATHTHVPADFIHSDFTLLTFPLIHPDGKEANKALDLEVFARLLHTPSFEERLSNFVKHPDKTAKLIEMIRVRTKRGKQQEPGYWMPGIQRERCSVPSNTENGPSRGLKVISFRPGCSQRRTVFENQMLIYDHLQKEQGWHFHFIVERECIEADERFQWTGLTREECESFRGRHWFLHKNRKVKRLMELACGSDLILTADPVVYPQALLAIEAARRLGIPFAVVATITLLTESINTRWYSIKYRELKRVMAEAAGILIPSPKVIERFDHLHLLPDSTVGKFHLIGHPCDVESFVPCAGRRVPGRILCASRLITNKGTAYILEAFATMAARLPHAHLVFIGKGPMDAWLRKRACELGLDARVLVMPTVPHSDLPELLQTGDCFVSHALSTHHWEEYFGVANLEAMACGLPVISTVGGGITFALRPPAAFRAVQERDIGDLAQAMVEMLTQDEKTRLQTILQNRHYIEENYSPDVMADAFQRAIERTKSL